MANLDRPLGLRALSAGVAGTAPRLTQYAVSATLTAAIYEGDLVYKGALGIVAVADATDTTEVQNIIGVAANYVAATPGADKKVHVYDDPAQKFLVQVDDNAISTAALEIESIGKYARATVVTGNTSTLQSKMELDGSSITSVASTWECLQVLAKDSRSVASGSWADVEVQINPAFHIYSSNHTRST
ncbi:MAG: hypothetical protein AMJ55_03000 [Gammaproteobacteria bacterium SG8_15]|nr:MAG: hypothetical protein AMJ55_03000 [Gammaproteobacteria bacterium SG8_15]